MTGEWSGRSVLVVGLGIAGRAAAHALLAAGANVVAVERDVGPETQARAAGLRTAGADVRLGTQDPDVLRTVDVVVTSPGVPPAHPLLEAALGAGLPVCSEPELAWRLSQGATRLVAVTGTNGKTTTVELLAALLDAPAAGNIGTPLVELIATGGPPVVVAELSSFQLRFTTELRAHVAVLLNVAPDHLDWHPDFDDYVASKARAWARQLPGDWAVVNADDAGALRAAHRHPPPAGLLRFGRGSPATGEVGVDGGWIVERVTDSQARRVLPTAELRARGPHNLANCCAAVAAALALGRRSEDLAAPLAAFTPGAHRLEPVATVDGVRWVNDSKATNPHAAAAALASYERVVWIAGGLNKGLEFTGLADVVRRHVRAVVTVGSAGPEIAAFARGLDVTTVEAVQMDAAVEAAGRLARDGDVVLLSPACASMDQFRDYAERGERFRDLVRRRATRAVGHAR